ncbi:DUF7680 family protein [Rhodococcus sp. P14]|uniref:DUF7680 family protein n=1 Tax=Rhodococcus sp. P14 TaxID=450821 RepID=UPI0012F683AF|nr:hypothetical protein [Rhodococcus sp. P14]
MTRSENYICQIDRDDDGRVIALIVISTDLDGTERQVRVNGYRAIHVAASLQDVLQTAKLRGRELTSSKPIPLSPQIGVHVELILRAVKPIKRVDRITAVAEGVAGMSREEAAYWHAQINRRNGLRALRLLLAEGNKR